MESKSFRAVPWLAGGLFLLYIAAFVLVVRELGRLVPPDSTLSHTFVVPLVAFSFALAGSYCFLLHVSNLVKRERVARELIELMTIVEPRVVVLALGIRASDLHKAYEKNIRLQKGEERVSIPADQQGGYPERVAYFYERERARMAKKIACAIRAYYRSFWDTCYLLESIGLITELPKSYKEHLPREESVK